MKTKILNFVFGFLTCAFIYGPSKISVFTHGEAPEVALQRSPAQFYNSCAIKDKNPTSKPEAIPNKPESKDLASDSALVTNNLTASNSFSLGTIWNVDEETMSNFESGDITKKTEIFREMMLKNDLPEPTPEEIDAFVSIQEKRSKNLVTIEGGQVTVRSEEIANLDSTDSAFEAN